ncbi:MAG: hypothetical protein E7617_03140 [Ruminococcaceae bacterium]|nr:hypothetical protein [Oscillospiraceae bacterium]
MKKILSTVMVCALLVGCVFTFAGCVLSVGPMTFIYGEYEADLAIAEYDFEFSPLGGVTVTVDPIIGDNSVHEGKYKVNSETKEITLTWEGDAPALFDNGTIDFSSGEEDGVEYIKLGAVKLTATD